MTLIQTPRAARPVICGGAALPLRPTGQLNASAAEDPIGPGSHQPVRAPRPRPRRARTDRACTIWPFEPAGDAAFIEIYPCLFTGKVVKS